MNTILRCCLIVVLTLLTSGCSGSMTGTVVDAETGKPIEGAVIHAQWSETKGVPGLTYGQTYKIEEAVTDASGQFRLEGVSKPFVNPPRIVVYKKGHVAWRNDFIFPGERKREDFVWKNGSVIKLEYFKKYSHSRHMSFIRLGLSMDAKYHLYRECSWEDKLSTEENVLVGRKRANKKSGEYTEDELYQEAVDELYLLREEGKMR